MKYPKIDSWPCIRHTGVWVSCATGWGISCPWLAHKHRRLHLNLLLEPESSPFPNYQSSSQISRRVQSSAVRSGRGNIWVSAGVGSFLCCKPKASDKAEWRLCLLASYQDTSTEISRGHVWLAKCGEQSGKLAHQEEGKPEDEGKHNCDGSFGNWADTSTEVNFVIYIFWEILNGCLCQRLSVLYFVRLMIPEAISKVTAFFKLSLYCKKNLSFYRIISCFLTGFPCKM